MARKSAIRRLLKKLPAAPIRLLTEVTEIPELIDTETGELQSGAAPRHLSDEDIAAGAESIDDAGAVEHGEWIDDYERG